MATPAEENEQSVRDEVEATTRAVLAADEADIQEATEGVPWERRGLLQRLTRADRTVRRRRAFDRATTALDPQPESTA